MNPCIDIFAPCDKIFVAGDIGEKLADEQTERILTEQTVTDEFSSNKKRILPKELDKEKISEEKNDKNSLSGRRTPKSDVTSRDQTVLLENEPELTEEVKTQEHMERLKSSSSFNKLLEEAEPKTITDDDLKLEDIIKPLSEESVKRINEFFLYLRDIHNMILKPKRQEMKELQEVIALITNEIQEMEKKNRELEREIEVMRKI